MLPRPPGPASSGTSANHGFFCKRDTHLTFHVLLPDSPIGVSSSRILQDPRRSHATWLRSTTFYIQHAAAANLHMENTGPHHYRNKLSLGKEENATRWSCHEEVYQLLARCREHCMGINSEGCPAACSIRGSWGRECRTAYETPLKS